MRPFRPGRPLTTAWRPLIGMCGQPLLGEGTRGHDCQPALPGVGERRPDQLIGQPLAARRSWYLGVFEIEHRVGEIAVEELGLVPWNESHKAMVLRIMLHGHVTSRSRVHGITRSGAARF
jgi:hypothetical protein